MHKPNYTLYYFPLNASMAPRFVLEKIDVDYELVLLDRASSAQKNSEYLALNPLGRIPTLLDGQLVLYESAAICIYLAEKHPQAMLMPEVLGPQRALFYQWMIYLTNTLQAELMLFFYPQRYVSEPENTARFLDSLEQRIAEMLGYIDAQLEHSDFLLGEQVSVCDYFLFMLCVWADELKKPPLTYTYLSKTLKKVAALAEVSGVCQDENLSLNDYLPV